MDERVTIYMNESDRQAIKLLLSLLAEQGCSDVIDSRGNPSMAALIRLLVKEKLAELEVTP